MPLSLRNYFEHQKQSSGEIPGTQKAIQTTESCMQKGKKNKINANWLDVVRRAAGTVLPGFSIHICFPSNSRDSHPEQITYSVHQWQETVTQDSLLKEEEKKEEKKTMHVSEKVVKQFGEVVSSQSHTLEYMNQRKKETTDPGNGVAKAHLHKLQRKTLLLYLLMRRVLSTNNGSSPR